MKNLIVLLTFMLIGSFALANNNSLAIGSNSTIVWVSSAISENKAALSPEACWILDITVSCGGTYSTQYCNEGLHGSLASWIMQVDTWACP
jgi:hypothetical protein